MSAQRAEVNSDSARALREQARGRDGARVQCTRADRQTHRPERPRTLPPQPRCRPQARPLCPVPMGTEGIVEVILRLFPCPYLPPPPPSNKQSDRKTNRPGPGLFSRRGRPILPSPSPRLSPTKFLQAGPLRFRSAHQLIKGKRPAVHAQTLFPPAAFLFNLF